MSEEKKRPGPKMNLERNERLGFMGRSKKQIADMRAGRPINYAAHKWVDFNAGKECGSIVPSRLHTSYDNFSSQELALAWWGANRVQYMREYHERYLREGEIRPGRRPNMFFECEFGLSYPSDVAQVAIIESHSLWWPGERDRLLAASQGKEIPVVPRCKFHVNGYPPNFSRPDQMVLALVDGRLQRGIFPECEVVNDLYKHEERKLNLNE